MAIVGVGFRAAGIAGLCTMAFASPSTRTTHASELPAPTVRKIVVGNGETLAVHASPDANPRESQCVVVLLPGTVGSAFAMRNITAALTSQGQRSIVVDLLGTGASSYPTSANYSLTQQAARVTAVLDSLSIAHALVVAQGTSATVALHLAASDSARVGAVISLSGGGVDQQGTRSVRTALALTPLLKNPVGRALARRKFRAGLREQSANDTWLTDDVLREYLRPFESDMRAAMLALQAMSEAVEPVPIQQRLSRVRAPVLLLMGAAHSHNTPTGEQIANLQRGLRQFRVDTIRGSGTMLAEERPDAVLVAIAASLRVQRSL